MSIFPLTQGARHALEYELELLSHHRPVAAYYLVDLGLNLYAVIVDHGTPGGARGDDDIELVRLRYSVIVWRLEDDRIPTVISRQSVNVWPL
jgi:hypothetical protein